jgi:hypothetical protein
LNADPEQDAQSGWQGVQVLAFGVANDLVGQEETHVPAEASWLPLHVRQKSAALAQVVQVEAQAGKSIMYQNHENDSIGPDTHEHR